MGSKQRLRAEAQRLREINIGWRQTAAEQSHVNRLLLGEIERLREVAASAASLVRIAGDAHGAAFVESRIIPTRHPTRTVPKEAPMLETVIAELERATVKFPTWPTDPLHALGVLHEEVGELSKEVLQLVYEPHKTSAAKVREEAIQAAAMALRFAMSLDTYQYTPGAQHSQAKDGPTQDRPQP